MASQPKGEVELITRGRRASQRARLHLNATLATIAQDHPVILRNLSVTGAMVQLEANLPSGRTVTLRRGLLDELATVIWCRNGFCGIEFVDPIKLDTVLDLAAEPIELAAARGPDFQLVAGNEIRLSQADWHSAKEYARRRFGRA